MAVYKLFPEQDSFIFTEQLNGNTGLDEIIEIGGYTGAGEDRDVSRILIKFSQEEIENIVNNTISGSEYTAHIRLYLAEASELPTRYTLEGYLLAQPWINGTGKFDDVPPTTNGVSWSTVDGITPWTIPTITLASVTTSSIAGKPGGGSWFTEVQGINLGSFQEHLLNSTHDISLDVTEQVKLFFAENVPNNQPIDNNGFIIKLQESYEFTNTSDTVLKYFGKDTNTIYPPCLEFRWDDSQYITGSSNILTTNQNVIVVKNNKGTYYDEGKQRFFIRSRPQFPTPTFTTSSIYLDNYALPQNTYWGLKDEFSNEMIVDFDPIGTKVSWNGNQSYFDIYMDGLQPERYYRILIKTEIQGSTTIIDNENIFKVIQNV